jgi:Protein of unknown function (DUF1353)
MKNETITWKKIPTFQLINDETYHTFICVGDGLVVLGDVELDFPIGWTTDITSTPQCFAGFISQIGPHSPAAIIHDRLLEKFPREYARKWMYIQLKELRKVSPISRWLMYLGVWFWDNIYLKLTK